MTQTSSRLLRGILGINGGKEAHRLATYLRFEPEEAVKIRVPLCPRCGDALRVESGALPGTPLIALLCRRCHRAAILRRTLPEIQSDTGTESQVAGHPESEEVSQRVS